MSTLIELVAEIIMEVIQYLLVRLLKLFGAGVRWVFRLGKTPFSQILKENGNGRLAGLILAGVGILLIIWFFVFDSPTEAVALM